MPQRAAKEKSGKATYPVTFVEEHLCLVEGPKADTPCRTRIRLWISHMRTLAHMAAKRL
jgi:hypothetical protein